MGSARRNKRASETLVHGTETQGASVTPPESDFGPDPDQIILSVDEPGIVSHVLAKFRLVSRGQSACISVHSLGFLFPIYSFLLRVFLQAATWKSGPTYS